MFEKKSNWLLTETKCPSQIFLESGKKIRKKLI